MGAAGSLSESYLEIGQVKILWGNFVNSTVDFLIIALVVYLGVKLLKLDKLNKKKE